MTRNVFTYGSLMFAPVWTRVVVGNYASTGATLADHARFAVAGQDYPGMIPLAGAGVEGVLYRDVGAADLDRLDQFEGDDYARQTVTLACADGVTRSAETYIYLKRDCLLATRWEPAAFAMDHFIATYCREKLETRLEPRDPS